MPRHPPISPEKLKRIRDLRDQNISLHKIHEILKMDKRTIRKILGIPEPEKKAVSKNIFNWEDYKGNVLV